MTTPAMLSPFVVVDTCDGEAGRYCARLFALMGAHVVRVSAPPNSLVGQWLDEGKCHASTLDEALDALADHDPEYRLVLAGQSRTAVDAVEDAIERRRINTLFAAITWFGRDGPLRDWAGDDALILALNGIAAAFGTPDGPPTLPQGFAMQITAGATLTVGTLAGLWKRRHGGRIASVETSVLEAALCFGETGPPRFEANPDAPVRKDVNRYTANHPMTIYPASDGWVGITTSTPAQWNGLAQLVEHPAWIDDPLLSTTHGRVDRMDAIDRILREKLTQKPASFWVEEGQRLRVPVAPVPQPAEVLRTPHWIARRSFRPLTANIDAPNLPFRIASGGGRIVERPFRGALPLSGIRVADFSMGWAGPLATRLLGDLGADVIKIESPTHRDWWRGWEPDGDSDPPLTELSPMFNVMNRNKRGFSLDLNDPGDLKSARRIVRSSDIVIENHAPGVMRKLRLGPEQLLALRPGLVAVSMGAFGATGPWSAFRAYGATVEQASGMPHVNGHPAWPPALQHFAFGDPVAGIYAAVAALAGLHGRSIFGGAWFDLAQVECLFQLGADMLIAAQVQPIERMGSASAQVAPRCVVKTCGGGHVAIACRNEEDWHALARWLARPEWSDDPVLSSVAGRNAHADRIVSALVEIAGEQDATVLVASLQAAGIPAAPVLLAQHLAEAPALREMGIWRRIRRRYVGEHVIAAPVFHVDGRRLPIYRPAPIFGEHSADIAAEISATS
ncbi:MAG: CoA transferase [Sphingomonas bacterium]